MMLSFKKLFILCIWVFSLSSVHEGQEKVLDLSELELQIIMRGHVGAGR